MGCIEDYIKRHPAEVQSKLREMHQLIRSEIPGASEVISWSMPTLSVEGRAVHFAAYKHHIGFYPGPETIEAFKSQFTQYRWSKGAVQFPLSEPLPIALIQAMVRHRINLAK